MYTYVLHTDDFTLTFGPICYENDYKFDCNTFPQVPQGGPISIELDSSFLQEIIRGTITENSRVVNLSMRKLSTEVGKTKLHSGRVLSPRLTPPKN